MSTDVSMKETGVVEVSGAVSVIKTAILQSQARAAKGINQEQLALYYGIGRFISVNTRKRNWGAGVIDGISERLRAELPGLRGVSGTNLRNMRTFYEAWYNLEVNSSVQTDELTGNGDNAGYLRESDDKNDDCVIRQLELSNLPKFPLKEFLSISFSHHMAIIVCAKTLDERMFYIRYCHEYKTHADELPTLIKKLRPYEHQDTLPNNFVQTMPDYKQAFRAM